MNKTIEARELRLGNWVIFDTDQNGKMYLPIDVIRIDQVCSGFNISYYDAPTIEPIELTPEILEKIGKRSSVFGDTRTYWIIGDFLYCEDEPVLNKGLHWLQNFHYFRTGEELPLTL